MVTGTAIVSEISFTMSKGGIVTRWPDGEEYLPHERMGTEAIKEDKIPLLYLKRKAGTNWEYNGNLTGVYLGILNEIATSSTSFKDAAHQCQTRFNQRRDPQGSLVWL